MVNKIKNTIYAYDPNEFLPIFVDGRLDNRDQFIAYKAKRAAGKLGMAIYKTYETTYYLLERAGQ